MAHTGNGGFTAVDALAGTVAVTTTSAVTAGNCLVAFVSWSAGGSGNSPTVTSSPTNSWTQVATAYDATNVQGLSVYVAPNVASGSTTVTATFGTNADFRRISVGEFSGRLTVSPVNGTPNVANPSYTAAGTDVIVGTAVVTTVDGCDLFECFQNDTSVLTGLTGGTGWTSRVGNTTEHLTASQTQSTAGSITPKFSLGTTNDTANKGLLGVVALAPAATPTVPPRHILTVQQVAVARSRSY